MVFRAMGTQVRKVGIWDGEREREFGGREKKNRIREGQEGRNVQKKPNGFW